MPGSMRIHICGARKIPGYSYDKTVSAMSDSLAYSSVCEFVSV